MTKTPFNILLTSGGRRVALVKQFERALAELRLPGLVFVADASIHSAAFHAAHKGFVVPRVTDSTYLPALKKLCAQQSIRLVVPLIDTELSVLAEAKKEFETIGTTLLVSAPEVIALTRDKKLTYDHFVSNNIPTPALLNTDKILSGAVEFPIFLKPANGSRSQGSRVINDLKEFQYWYPRTPNPLALEYIDGKEYTIDVFVTKEGKPAIAVPRWRQEVRDGEISKGVTLKDNLLMESAIKVAQSFRGARGVLTTQCRVNAKGIPVYFEVNARFGGGAPLSIQAGADFPKWIIQEELNVPTTEFDFQAGVRMYRYDDAIWVQE